ncbi:siroheme synthase [Shewanella sp. OPT22]|nr:siroheme synthase [Shewanella sp. OPT22]
MQYFPIFVDTQNINVLVVGAGEVAARKLALLVRTEAKITVIADKICDEVDELVKTHQIQLKHRLVNEDDIAEIQLLYLATADRKVNQQYAALATQNNILVNVVDSPEDCSFITPAIVDRGKLQIAISSSGAAPVVAGLIRTKIESWLPQSVSQLIEFAANTRSSLKQTLNKGVGLRQFWYQFFNRNGFGFSEVTPDVFQQTLEQCNEALGTSVTKIYFIQSEQDISTLPISVLPILQQIDDVYFEDEVPQELNELIRRDATRNRLRTNQTYDFQSANVLVYATSCNLPNTIFLK